MSDLTMQKWEAVVVDWANCLEISKRVPNISGLKSGEFFKALLDILQPELHSTVGDFLGVHYPNFAVSGEHVKGLREYNDEELTVAASLLLHYMCIHDRRDELIAPLCQKLTGVAQMHIKSFLEHFIDEATPARFGDVVRKVMGGEAADTTGNLLSTPKTMEWNSSGESPLVCHSPLYEYFKTPAAKTAKMQEKDKEIRRLQRDLQQERDEREDMNVELTEHKNRIQKISSEVCEKSVIIAQLTERVTLLEEQPPSTKPREVIEIEKLLRQELADAQQYITELQVDHGELFDKRREMLEKLAKSEESACLWQTRAEQLESKLDETHTNYKAQEVELNNLQVNYNELSTLLEELRQSNTNASQLEMDTSATHVTVIEPKSPEENLASTVVEIQLKECQMEMRVLQDKLTDQLQESDTANKKLEETIQELVECKRNFAGLNALKHEVDITLDKYILTNEKLEKKINQLATECSDLGDANKKLELSLSASIESSQKLEDELADVKSRLADVNNSHQQLEIRNEEFLEQILTLQKSEESLMSTNAKIIAEVERLKRENLTKDGELETLKENLLKRDATIEKNEELLASLNRDLEKIEQARNDFEDKLEQKNLLYSVLEEESKALQHKYEDAVDAYNQTDFKLITLQKQLKENDNKFQVSLDKLDKIITGSIQSSNVEKWERIEALLGMLDKKQMTFESTIDNFKQLNASLEERCESMCKESLVQQDNYKKIQAILEQTEDKVRVFENEVKSKVEKIYELEETISHMNDSITKLEAVKLELATRLDEASENNGKLTEDLSKLSLNEISMTSMLEQRDREVSYLESLHHEKDIRIKSLQDVQSEKEIMNVNLEQQVVSLQSSIHGLHATKDNLLQQLEISKSASDEQLQANEMLKACLGESKMEIATLQTENSMLKNELSKLQTANDDLFKKQVEMQSLHEELNGQYESLLQKCELIEAAKLLFEKESADQQMALNQDISSLRSEKVKLEVDISKLENSNSHWMKKHEECERQRSDLEMTSSALSETVGELSAKCKLIEDEIGCLQTENVQLKFNINEINCEIHTLKEVTTEKIYNLNGEVSNMQNENSLLKNTIQELEDSNQSWEKQHDDLQLQNEKIINKCECIEKETADLIKSLNSDVTTLQNENSSLKSHNSALQSKHSEIIQISQSEKQLLEEAITQQKSLHAELQQENCSLKTTFTDLQQSNHRLKTLHDKLQSQHQEILKKCETINSEKQLLEKETTQQLNTLKTNINALENSNGKLKTQHGELQKLHEDIIKKCDQIQSEKQLLEKETAEQINTLNTNVLNLKVEKSRLENHLIDLEDARTEVVKKCESIEAEKRSYQKSTAEEINNLQHENDLLKDNIKGLQISNEDWQTQHTELQTQYAEIIKQCDLIGSEKQELENNNSSLSENLESVESRNIELREEIQRLTAQFEKIKLAKQALFDETTHTIESLNVEISNLQEENVTLRGNIHELQLSNENWSKQYTELKSSNVDLTERIDQLVHRSEQLQADIKAHAEKSTMEINTLKQENAALEKDIQELKDSNTNWGKQHAELHKMNMELSKQIEDLVQKCTTIENAKQIIEKQSLDQMNTMNDNLSSLQSELYSANDENTANKKTLGELIIEIDSQLVQLKEKDSELASLKQEYLNNNLECQKNINRLNQHVMELEKIKVSLETDLQMAKDDSNMKQQELQELRKSKYQLEKELNKRLEQHEKKIDLMQLTIDNLEKKVVELQDDKCRTSNELEEQTHKLIAITAEKGKLSGEHNQTMNELISLKQQLVASELECSRKDDVIDEHTQELFALKLDIEVKTSELSSCKSKISTLDEEKTDAIKSAHSLREELKKLNLQHKNTIQELKAITDMKNSLNMKMDLFKENMQAVFAHFDIKKKNMKQSLEELKKYKSIKEAEIKALNTDLNEVRTILERTKEENHSTIKELQHCIDCKNKQVKQLEQEIESMKTTESGCLQEIGMLKDELNYTIDKYSEALTAEKEQKAENDLQIQNLTESLHGLLEKYNILDKEHNELQDAMNYNKQALEEMKADKDGLELKIVQLKNEYDDDAKNCKDEFQAELSTLKKIEKSLKVEVNDLKKVMTNATSENERVSRELQDAKSQLHIIQCERANLVNKLDELELSKVGLKKDYDSLKIAHESYMKESKAALIEKHDQLQVEKKAHESVIAAKDKECRNLKRDANKYLERMKREEEAYKKESELRQRETAELHTSIANFLSNIETLTKEKDALSKKIQQQEKLFQKLVHCSEEKDSTILMYEKQLQNLQISHDVLEAGKIKMEKMQADLQERVAAQDKQHRIEKHKFENSRSNLQSQLEKTTAQLRESEQVVKQRTIELEAANEECESVQAILTNMSKKMEASSRQLAVIHEDYEGKLRHERESFRQLKEQYETAAKEMEYMGGLTAGLRSELDEVRRERADAETAIHEREETIAELQRKYDAVVNQIGAKDATIASLQAELAVGFGRLAHAADARRTLEHEQRRAATQLAQVEAERAGLVEAHAGTLRAVEENLLRTEREVGAVMARMEEARAERKDVDGLLAAEREAKAFLERRAVDLEAQVLEAERVKTQLAATIRRIAALLHEQDSTMDEEALDDVILKTEQQIIIVFGKLRELGLIRQTAVEDRDNALKTLEQMDKCNQQLNLDKEKLLANYEKLHEEKATLLKDKSEDSKNYQHLLVQHELLRQQHQSSSLLNQKLEQLEDSNKKYAQHYFGLQEKLQQVFKNVENLVNERNHLEQIVYNLRDQYSSLQIKSIHITEASYKLHFEQKMALEIIIDDISKQFRRISKMIYNLNIKCHQIADKSVSAILENKTLDWLTLLGELSFEEISEKLEDLRDNANNTQLQLETFMTSIEALGFKDEKPRVLKENVQQVKQPPKEEEWRKKYLSVKQKLTLVENAKNNFEKKIKQLRDENKKLSIEKPIKVEVTEEIVKQEPVEETDKHYKKLLQDYIQLKEDHETDLSLWKDKYEKLECEFSKSTSRTSLQSDLQTIEDLQSELTSLRVSYRDVKIAFSKLQLDYSALETLLAERNDQLANLNSTKEGYSNLGEENTKLKSEIDTLKYKRQRDRDKFLQHVEREEAELTKKMQAVRAEYDLKLDKMKEKIVCKYKEQVDQNESQRYEKMLALKKENDHYRNTVQMLKEELGKTQARSELLDSEKQLAIQDLKVARGREAGDFDFKEPATLSRRASSHSLHSEVRSAYVEERRSTFSLPRNVQTQHAQMGVIEEVHYRRLSNVAPVPVGGDGMEMEDEGEMFNNKYLHDLKEGRPSFGIGRESSSSRLSEFAYRNSLCPPHLKSSYPAETQFLTDCRFKDDDLKSGNIDFMDDSMKTQLLPNEKHKKKDAGTTSYKRPGPPTPSKHGGRSSLQGNERVLRENGDAKHRSTANPLRSLFSSSKKVAAASDGGPSSTTTIVENAGTASPKKRPSLSFFRR